MLIRKITEYTLLSLGCGAVILALYYLLVFIVGHETLALASEFNPLTCTDLGIWLDLIEDDPFVIFFIILFVGSLAGLTISLLYYWSKKWKKEATEFFSDGLIWSLIVIIPASMGLWLEHGVEYVIRSDWKKAQLLDSSPGYHSFLNNYKERTRFHANAEKRLLDLDLSSTVEVNTKGIVKPLQYSIDKCISDYMYKNGLRDIKFHISIDGTALSSTYSSGLSRYKLYTGASITGDVRINKLHDTFAFEMAPPSSVRGESVANEPEDAPIKAVIATDLLPYVKAALQKETGKNLAEDISCKLYKR